MQPVRLAVGHQTPESGAACAMQVIAWETGDLSLSDTPPCVALPLAKLVQLVNDTYCTHLHSTYFAGSEFPEREYLCAPCSVDVLGLAHRTPGTSDVEDAHVWRWVAELLDGEHGVSQWLLKRGVRDYLHQAASVARAIAADPTYSRYFAVDAPMSAMFGASEHTLCALRMGNLALNAARRHVLANRSHGLKPWPAREFRFIGSIFARPATMIAYPGATHAPVSPADVLATAHRLVDVWHAVAEPHSPPPAAAEQEVAA